MADVTAYYQALSDDIQNNCQVFHQDLSFRQMDDQDAYIKGRLYLHGGIVLHIAEYVIIKDNTIIKDKYRYQLQNHKSEFISRWDNAPHHTEVTTFPDHMHCKDGTIKPSTIDGVLDVLNIIDTTLNNTL